MDMEDGVTVVVLEFIMVVEDIILAIMVVVDIMEFTNRGKLGNIWANY